MKRPAQPEIAPAFVFRRTRVPSYITGEILPVIGGTAQEPDGCCDVVATRNEGEIPCNTSMKRPPDRANKVEGTGVFNLSGEELGKIHEIMINKITGQVAYAVMAFGGVLGMAAAIAWLPSSLTYDTKPLAMSPT
jgi:hypothetical protein